MSDSPGHARRHEDTDIAPFGGDEVLPFEQQRRVHQFLTQETRYHVLLTILGHPAHLVTLDEFEYLVPKNRSTIRDHLDRLREKHIVDKYVYDGEERDPRLPREFWGLTEYGVNLLYEYNYLRYVPVLRALQDHLYLTEKIQRHRDAPRPALPEAVAEAFDTPDPDDEVLDLIDEGIEAGDADAGLFDAPPIEPDPDAEVEADADRPIDELF